MVRWPPVCRTRRRIHRNAHFPEPTTSQRTRSNSSRRVTERSWANRARRCGVEDRELRDAGDRRVVDETDQLQGSAAAPTARHPAGRGLRPVAAEEQRVATVPLGGSEQRVEGRVAGRAGGWKALGRREEFAIDPNRRGPSPIGTTWLNEPVSGQPRSACSARRWSRPRSDRRRSSRATPGTP